MGCSAAAATGMALAKPVTLTPPTEASAGIQSPIAVPRSIAAEVVGGAYVDINWPAAHPWRQSYDNLRFDADVDSSPGSTNSTPIYTFADNTKLALTTVSTPAPSYEGRLHRRYLWPVDGYFDATFKYIYGGQLYVADSLKDQALHPDVHIYTVQFHNLSAGSQSTSVSSSFLSDRVDRMTAGIPSATSSTIDGIYGDCGDCGGLDKTQWRLDSVDTVSVSASCSDLNATRLAASTSACNTLCTSLLDVHSGP